MSFIEFSDIKKGRTIIMKDQYPCKIVNVQLSAPGKHGHAKKAITGIDILTGKKYEEIYTHHSHIKEPVVDRQGYEVIHIDDDGFLSLMDDNGDVREDVVVTGDLRDELEGVYDNITDKIMYVNLLTVTIGERIETKVDSYKVEK